MTLPVGARLRDSLTLGATGALGFWVLAAGAVAVASNRRPAPGLTPRGEDDLDRSAGGRSGGRRCWLHRPSGCSFPIRGQPAGMTRRSWPGSCLARKLDTGAAMAQIRPVCEDAGPRAARREYTIRSTG
jgi:hypothetical protein